MSSPPSFDVDPALKELLAKNVPAKFNRSVETVGKKRSEEYSTNQQEEDFRFCEVVRCLHPSPSFKNQQVLSGKLRPILNVYLAMKQTVDQVVDPKSVSKELLSLVAKLQTVEARLRNDARDRVLMERLEIKDISALGHDSKAFGAAGQIDEKIAVAHQSISHMLREIGVLNSYFEYKTDQLSGRGRRKNDYSVHYMVFALADLFLEVGKIDGAIMVSFNDDDEPTSAFWELIKTFCYHLDRELEKEYKGNFPEMIKTMCRRYQKSDYCTKRLTAYPDTQLLLGFMSAVHLSKSKKVKNP